MLDSSEQLKISFTGLKIFERQEAKVGIFLQSSSGQISVQFDGSGSLCLCMNLLLRASAEHYPSRAEVSTLC